MRNSTQIVEVVSQITPQIFKTKTGDVIQVFEVIGQQGLEKKPYEELINFLQQVAKRLKSFNVASHWFIQKEPLKYQNQIHYYRQKQKHQSFELTDRAKLELEAEIKRLEELELGQSIERYYLVILAVDHQELKQAVKWLSYHQDEVKNRPLTEAESIKFFHQLYN